MDILITTHDRDAAFKLLGSESASQGQQVVVGDGILATFRGALMRKAVGFPEVVAFGIAVSAATLANVAANAIWAWLTSKLKERPESVTIDRIEVEFDQGEITKLITERLTRQKDDGHP